MEKVVSEIAARYGSMEGYLRDADVDDSVLERLRAKCLV
jgi:Tyrosine phosphatase family